MAPINPENIKIDLRKTKSSQDYIVHQGAIMHVQRSWHLLHTTCSQSKIFQSTFKVVARTMKFASTVFAVLVSIVSLLANGVSSTEYQVLQVLLNRGNSFYCIDRWDACCNTTEWNYIQSKVYTMSQLQRSLGSEVTVPTVNVRHNRTTSSFGTDTTSTTRTDVVAADRELKSYPNYCKSKCAGIAAGRCLAAKCQRYRHRRTAVDHHNHNDLPLPPTLLRSSSSSSSPPMIPERELYYSTSCSNQKSEMTNLLNNMVLQKKLGPRCGSLLSAPRTMTCSAAVPC